GLRRTGQVVRVVVTPALELAERNQDQLPAWDQLDHRLDASLERVEAHPEACGSLLAAQQQARHRLHGPTGERLFRAPEALRELRSPRPLRSVRRRAERPPDAGRAASTITLSMGSCI